MNPAKLNKRLDVTLFGLTSWFRFVFQFRPSFTTFKLGNLGQIINLSEPRTEAQRL